MQRLNVIGQKSCKIGSACPVKSRSEHLKALADP
jgi:hypothetical protein